MGASKLSTNRLSNKFSYGSMLAGNIGFIDSAFESIATTVVGAGGASSITFSSIPSTYTHLQIRTIAKSNGLNSNLAWNANSDTSSANYAAHFTRGNSSVVQSDGIVSGSSNSFIIANEGVTISSDANSTYGATVIDLLDYANTSKNKTTRALGGRELNGSGAVTLSSGVWFNTNAVNSITLYVINGSFIQYSSFALYGIKG
jgi:hypothetical protein